MPFASHSYDNRLSIVCTVMSHVCHLYVTCIYSYAIHVSLVFARILSVCTRMSFLCHSYVLIWNGMSFICCSISSECHWSMSSVYHSYVLVFYQYVTVCTRMSSVCHSYVLLCHPHVTGMYSYVICMSLVCDFTMNPSRLSIF